MTGLHERANLETMNVRATIFAFSFLITAFISCRSTRSSILLDRSLSYRATVETKQFFFTFPVDSFAFNHRQEIMKECEDALDFNLKLLKQDSFPKLLRVHYYNSKGDLRKYLNVTSGGMGEVWKNAIYLVQNKKAKAPTRHEMMHIIAAHLFGYASPASWWLDEGLATYAVNNCNGFTVEQRYAYFLHKKMLAGMDSLTNSFFKHDNMIVYPQAGYIVQWLLEHYGMDKLKRLWQSSFDKFESIYGVPYGKIELDIEVYLRAKYPTAPDIDLDTLKEECRLTTFKSSSSNRASLSNTGLMSYRATVETKQFLFTFPVDSFAFTHREELMKECEEALAFDLKILKLDSFPNLMRVHYYNSRGDLWKYINMRPSGVAEPWRYTVYIVRTKESRGPTRHEIMHALSGDIFGLPPTTSEWLNEGLSTYADNNCSGFTVEQLYSYFSHKKMLISMDSLSNSFYKYDDMITYHQAGYITQWLLEHYGLDKIKQLWQSGFAKFEEIYGVPYSKVESAIEVYLKAKYPKPPDINWDTFKVQCR